MWKVPQPKDKEPPDDEGEMEIVFEPDRVGWFRVETLLYAGYPVRLAREIGENHEVDLHRACDLLAEGCDPQTAASILL